MQSKDIAAKSEETRHGYSSAASPKAEAGAVVMDAVWPSGGGELRLGRAASVERPECDSLPRPDTS